MPSARLKEYYTFEEYRREIYPITIEDLLEIDDSQELGVHLAEDF